MLNKNKSFFIASTWTVVVTVLSLISFGHIGDGIKIPNKDKMVHFVFYFLFVILWSIYFKYSNFNFKNKLTITFIAIGYGIVMELFQYLFTTTRTADIFDVLANSTGAILGYFFLMHYSKKNV